jgi:hypothetical protein
MRRRRFVIVATALAGLAACTTGAPPPAPSTGTTTSSPTPTPSRTVAEDDIKVWVEAARLTPAEVGAATPAADESGVIVTTPICGQALASDPDVIYAHQSIWAGTRLSYVEEGVYGYQAETAADVVAQAKRRVAGCHSYRMGDSASEGGSAQMTVTGEYALTTAAGVDASFAFCELSVTLTPANHQGEKASICTAFLGRGHILVTVRVFGDRSATMSSAQHALNQAVTVAAVQLVKAVPTA